MAKRRNYVAEIMAERVLYAGVVATRGEVYEDCVSRGLPWLAADRFAMSAKAATPEQVRTLPTFANLLAHIHNEIENNKK